MTVSRHKRRVSTSRALGMAVAGLVLAVALGVVGGVAIYNTKDGEAQGSGAPVDRFPDTPTGMIAVVDAAGNLGSVAVFAVRPAGDDGSAHGGSVVVLPTSADVSGGFGDERMPLHQLVSLYGTDSLGDDVSALLGVAIDDPLVLTADEMAAMLSPLGPLAVDLPDDVIARDGSVVASAGQQTLDPATLAAVLAAGNESVPALATYPDDVAVWQAIAAAIGPGLAAPPTLPAGTAPSIASDLAALTSGPVGVATIGSRSLSDLGVNPDGVDAAALDRAEVLTLFGHVAPSRVAAPNTGYTVLVRSPYDDEQLAGLSRYDVAYAATSALLGQEANVLSVDTTEGDAEAATIIEVADDSMKAAAEQLAAPFGDVDVRVADRRVAGVNMIVTLGTDYLTIVQATSRPSGGDSVVADSSGASDPEEMS